MTVDPLQRPARIARRLPGYSRLRRVLVPLVRGNDVLRRVAERLWLTAGEQRFDGSGTDITAGNLLDGIGRNTLPVVLIDARGLAADALSAVVEEIAELQLLTAGFRPVIIQSHADFSAVRRYGYPAEMMNHDREAGVPGPTWTFVHRAYRTALVLDVTEPRLSDKHRGLLLSFASDS